MISNRHVREMRAAFARFNEAQAQSVLPSDTEPKSPHELMQIALNKVILETLVALGANPSALAVKLKAARDNLVLTGNSEAADGVELAMRQMMYSARRAA